MNGLKITGQTCNFNYECGSRCCNDKVNSIFPVCDLYHRCSEKCKINSDCAIGPVGNDKILTDDLNCCLFDHCFHGSVCQASKNTHSDSNNEKERP